VSSSLRVSTVNANLWLQNYSKCDRLVAADFEDTTVGVDAVVESAMDVIGRYAEEFNRLFQVLLEL